MSSFGTRAREHGAAVLEDPMANDRTALNAALPRPQATPVGPRAVDR
jgi:hypothetical protein